MEALSRYCDAGHRPQPPCRLARQCWPLPAPIQQPRVLGTATHGPRGAHSMLETQHLCVSTAEWVASFQTHDLCVSSGEWVVSFGRDNAIVK